MSDFGFRMGRALAVLMALAGMASAQRLDPVKWSLKVEPGSAAPGSKVLGYLTATIEPGWHLYGLATPPPSQPTKIQFTGSVLSDKVTVYSQAPKKAFDNNFNIETQTYEGTAEFLLESAVKSDAAAGPAEVVAQLRYNACDSTPCLPPAKRTATASLT